MQEKDAVRRPQSRFSAGQVLIDESWPQELPDRIELPIAMLDDPEAPAATSALSVQEGGDHYKTMAIQPVEFIHANKLGYFEGNVIKYVSRWRSKGGVKDLEKARHYIDLLIELEAGR